MLIPVTLLAGGSASARELALLPEIRQRLQQGQALGVLIEGMPSGSGNLQDWLAEAALSQATTVNLQLHRLAPACLCCAGNMVMKVFLNRLLRQHPPLAAIFITLANAEHLPALRAQLSSATYQQHLELQEDWVLDGV